MYEFTHRIPHQPWDKPSRNEDAYFRRLELEQRARLSQQRLRASLEAREKELLSLRKGHCPECGSELQHIRVREGEADQCPDCRGVWLDQAMFRALTHPEDGNLARMLRSVVLQYSLGDLKPRGSSRAAD